MVYIFQSLAFGHETRLDDYTAHLLAIPDPIPQLAEEMKKYPELATAAAAANKQANTVGAEPTAVLGS
jgi:hypothetical protein